MFRLKNAVVCLFVLAMAACRPVRMTDDTSSGPTVSSVPPTRRTTETLFGVHEEQTTTISFACPQGARTGFEKLADDFHTTHPGIHVEILAIEELPGFDFANLMAPESTLPIVSSADTAMWFVSPQAAQSGLFRNLSPFIESDPGFAPEDFFPFTLEAYKWEGRSYALPTQISLPVLFYNQQAFDEIGLVYPTLDWTFIDFSTAARRLTIQQDDGISRYGFVDLASIGVDAFVVGEVRDLADESGEPKLTSMPLVNAVRWYTDLALNHGIMPNPSRLGPQEAASLVDAGAAAMWTDGLSNSANRPYKFDVGVASLPLPSAGGESHYPGRMYGYFMSAGTQHAEASWLWLSFLTHHDPLMAMSPDNMPARRSVAERTYYWTRYDEDVAATLQFVAEHLFFRRWDEPNWQLSVAVQHVFEGEPVEGALQQAQRTARENTEHQLRAQATPRTFTVSEPETVIDSAIPQVSFSAPTGHESQIQELANEFNAIQDAFEIRVTAASQQSNADCFSGQRSLGYERVRGELLNLQPLLDARDAPSITDMPSRFLVPFRHQGDLWGMPLQAQMRVMYYNRTLFDALGMAYPELGWSVDDFLDLAIALSKEGRYGYLALDGEASDLVAWLVLLGADPWDNEGLPRFDAPDMVDAVRWYTDLIVRHPVMPRLLSPNRANRTARLALVSEGSVAMWSDFTGMMESTELGLDDASVGMVPLPVGARAVSDFLYEGLFIAVDTPYPEQCWTWMQFMSDHFAPMGGMPARASVLASSDFAHRAGEDRQAAYTAMLEYVDARRLYDASARAGQTTYLLQAAIEIADGASPRVALSMAQRQALQHRGEVGD